MFLQKDYALRLKDFSKNGIFENYKKNVKNSYVFGQIEKSILSKKKLRCQFFCWIIFIFTYLLIIFWIY